MYHRAIPQVNAGSMADIAFLLLVFFLVTTTLDQDEGIQTILPPANKSDIPIQYAHRNVLQIMINGADQLMIEGERREFSDIRQVVRLFYTNPTESKEFPHLKNITSQLCNQVLQSASSPKHKYGNSRETWKLRLSATELIGSFKELPASAVISIQNDRSTSYATYILVQNELNAALNELRDECAISNFGVPYGELNENDPADQMKIRAIRMAFPRRISEAEPVSLVP